MAILGGLGQFIAGLFGFPAHDNFATVHFTWGSFFIAYGIEQAFIVAGYLPAVDRFATSDSLAMWFVTLAAITLCCFFASVAGDVVTAATIFLLALGSTLLFGG